MWTNLFVTERAGAQRKVVDCERLQAERRVQPQTIGTGAEARLYGVHLVAWHELLVRLGCRVCVCVGIEEEIWLLVGRVHVLKHWRLPGEFRSMQSCASAGQMNFRILEKRTTPRFDFGAEEFGVPTDWTRIGDWNSPVQVQLRRRIPTPTERGCQSV